MYREQLTEIKDPGYCLFCGELETTICEDEEGRGDHCVTVFYVYCCKCKAQGPAIEQPWIAVRMWDMTARLTEEHYCGQSKAQLDT